ncbi:MAG: hypothetical protein WEB57_12060, partial [Pseudohongiellaceae bacterium]
EPVHGGLGVRHPWRPTLLYRPATRSSLTPWKTLSGSRFERMLVNLSSRASAMLFRVTFMGKMVRVNMW